MLTFVVCNQLTGHTTDSLYRYFQPTITDSHANTAFIKFLFNIGLHAVKCTISVITT